MPIASFQGIKKAAIFSRYVPVALLMGANTYKNNGLVRLN
jgi:hypothetical protein